MTSQSPIDEIVYRISNSPKLDVTYNSLSATLLPRDWYHTKRLGDNRLKPKRPERELEATIATLSRYTIILYTT